MELVRLNLALRVALIALGFLWAGTALVYDRLPDAGDILPEVRTQPVQTPTAMSRFNVTRGGVTYAVRPLYDYKLYGLVVSCHDSRSWLDYAHQSWNDFLNVKDICVIWGSNTREERYRDFRFSSGQWTCSFHTDDREAMQHWNLFQVANNHMLSGSEEVTDALTEVEIGDQIFFRGFLAEYSHAGGFRRGTSTTRLDTGNGACETVYVTQLSILRKANPTVRTLYRVGKYGFVLSLLGLTALLLKRSFRPAAPDPQALLARGQRLAMRGRHAQALAALNAALDADPELAEALEDRALVWEILGEPGKALEDRRTLARLRGGSPERDQAGGSPFQDL